MCLTPGQQNEQLDEVQPVSAESDVLIRLWKIARSDGFQALHRREPLVCNRIGAKYIWKIKYIARYQVSLLAQLLITLKWTPIVPLWR